MCKCLYTLKLLDKSPKVTAQRLIWCNVLTCILTEPPPSSFPHPTGRWGGAGKAAFSAMVTTHGQQTVLGLFTFFLLILEYSSYK